LVVFDQYAPIDTIVKFTALSTAKIGVPADFELVSFTYGKTQAKSLKTAASRVWHIKQIK